MPSSPTYENHNANFLFVALTSSPKHFDLRNAARKTFLFGCMKYDGCMYRFFIDTPNPSSLLLAEANKYKDLVFRSEIPLMKKYPPYLHYGILNPLLEFNNSEVWYRMYKIEWKISFMKWIYDHDGNFPRYFLFVEDDSYICTEHLLHQLRLLSSYLPEISFRTGSYICKSGCSFDDSSTLMSGDIAELFVKHYPSAEFGCANVLSIKKLREREIIDWGRSWRTFQCNWKEVLEQYGLEIVHPDTQCRNAFFPFTNTLGALICQTSLPLIFHTTKHDMDARTRLIQSGNYNQHLCERFLLIDKVKNPSDIYDMWYISSSREYQDYSDVFRYDGAAGWRTVALFSSFDQMIKWRHVDYLPGIFMILAVMLGGICSKIFEIRRRFTSRSSSSRI